MEVGSGIALASALIAGGGVTITAIRSFANNKNGLCREHSGLVQQQKSFEGWLKRVDEKLDKLDEKVGEIHGNMERRSKQRE